MNVLDEFIIKRTPPRYKTRTGRDDDPREYTTTLYDEHGNLRDDGDLRKVERLYWEYFVDPVTARKLQTRLAYVESASYVPGTEMFDDMEEMVVKHGKASYEE